MSEQYEIAAKSLEELREFLHSAPSMFSSDQMISKHRLSNSENVCCVRWDGEFLISGADILRCIMFKFRAFGRDIVNRGKFEELIFSDLRSSKSSVRARLEEGKSELLEFLHTHGAIRTKKKQRVFIWSAVPHDELFLDSLERELRRAVVDDHNTEFNRITVAAREPAKSMRYDPLLKVAHQIPSIVTESDLAYLPLLCALFGYRPPASESTPLESHRLLSSAPPEHFPSQRPPYLRSRVSIHPVAGSSASANLSPAALPPAFSQTFPAPKRAAPDPDILYSEHAQRSNTTTVYPFVGYELTSTWPFSQDRMRTLRSSDSWLAPPAAADIRRDIRLPHIFDILPAYAQSDPPSALPTDAQNSSISYASSPVDQTFSESSSQTEGGPRPCDDQP